jgi:protein-tyrosine-phosphatase
MGEAILKQLVAGRLDADEWRIESAGTWALHGSSPAPLSQVVMLARGLDISHHQSQPVTEELIQQFDLVLAMESNHKESLQLVFKDRADRIFMISEVVGQREDISDPIGGELEDYHETADRLENILSQGLDRIIQLVKGHE